MAVLPTDAASDDAPGAPALATGRVPEAALGGAAAAARPLGWSRRSTLLATRAAAASATGHAGGMQSSGTMPALFRAEGSAPVNGWAGAGRAHDGLVPRGTYVQQAHRARHTMSY